MASRTIVLPFAIDVRATLGPLRHGAGDPTIRLKGGEAWRATRTPEGPATLHLHSAGDVVEAEAWGEGAEWALDHAPELIGCHDDRAGFAPSHPVVRDLHRRAPGLRIGRSLAVVEALIPAIIEQKVTGFEAKRAYRQLVRRFGEPAPGPAGLQLSPAPEVLADLGYYDFHPMGIERKRADTIRRVCAHAARLNGLIDLPSSEARERLAGLPGVGAWTVAEVAFRALGDTDAVSVGDYHLKDHVAYALTGEPRGTDERMLELLAPFAGQRGRVCRLIEHGAPAPPRWGPRLVPLPIAGL
jgi:3-methyladenine DNA glycosylase/8-oxoguanine DNA glycosylase